MYKTLYISYSLISLKIFKKSIYIIKGGESID